MYSNTHVKRYSKTVSRNVQLVLRLVCSRGEGYFWKILVEVCLPVLQILPLFQTPKCHSLHPFSDLASNIIGSLSDMKLFRLERQHKIHSEFACYRSFLYSFGIERTERLKLSHSSLQTNMCEVCIRFPTETIQIPYPSGRQIPVYGLYKRVPPREFAAKGVSDVARFTPHELKKSSCSIF